MCFFLPKQKEVSCLKKYIAMFVLVTILAYTSACSTPSHPITPEVEADIKQALYDERYAHRAETFDFSAQNIDITVYGSFEGVSVFYWNGITTESGFEAYDYDTTLPLKQSAITSFAIPHSESCRYAPTERSIHSRKQ